MQVRYDEGIANHIGPEPCAGIREDVGEASAGERAGQPLSRDFRVPTLSVQWKAICPRAPVRALGQPGVVGEPGMHTLLVREPGGLRIGRRLYWADGPRWKGEEP